MNAHVEAVAGLLHQFIKQFSPHLVRRQDIRSKKDTLGGSTDRANHLRIEFVSLTEQPEHTLHGPALGFTGGVAGVAVHIYNPKEPIPRLSLVSLIDVSASGSAPVSARMASMVSGTTIAWLSTI